jgi:tetratricopeptide (TPR) repeat protein
LGNPTTSVTFSLEEHLTNEGGVNEHPTGEKTALSVIASALALSASPYAFAQVGGICSQKEQSHLLSKPSLPTSSGALSAGAKVDPREEAAYKAFFKSKADDLDKRIQLGDAFVHKYPNGPFTEAVYSQLSTAEYQRQDFNKMDEYADKALALNPNDVTVLVFVDWVIPHSNDPSVQVDKAEEYEKRDRKSRKRISGPQRLGARVLAEARFQKRRCRDEKSHVRRLPPRSKRLLCDGRFARPTRPLF